MADISTHSLTRRLTKKQQKHVDRVKYFNSQPHKEADGRTHYRNERYVHFNSQPHKEADDEDGCSLPQFGHFNSQPHKEADQYCDIYI